MFVHNLDCVIDIEIEEFDYIISFKDEYTLKNSFQFSCRMLREHAFSRLKR